MGRKKNQQQQMETKRKNMNGQKKNQQQQMETKRKNKEKTKQNKEDERDGRKCPASIVKEARGEQGR